MPPCFCTPMCTQRATNPDNVREIRDTRTSPADSTADLPWAETARRLTRFAVLANDPAVRYAAGDYWTHSEPYYRQVMAQVDALVATDTAAKEALARLAENPEDTAAERRLEAELAAVLRGRGPIAELDRVLRLARENVYIGYHRGEHHRPHAMAVGVDDLLPQAASPPRMRRGRDEADILVVIPFRDTGETGRIRNLVACLLALRDQSAPADRYRITVVESDTVPRWRPVIGGLVDHYVHVRADGPFNKSWTVNVGVRETPGPFRMLCLIDADMLVDREFVHRNAARFDDPAHDGHLPYLECLALDLDSSNHMIDRRCRAHDAAAPLDAARGLVLRHTPGGCVWTRSGLFHHIGGFDERYAGWGGEDDDMILRLGRAGSIARFDDVMLHLAHRRPAMQTAAGGAFNAHLPIGTWNPGDGYGRITGPVSDLGREDAL